MTLKANGTVAYPVHIVLLNFTKDFQKLLMNHRNSIGPPLQVLVSKSFEEIKDDNTA